MSVVAILSDIHSNLPALEAVLADADRLGYGPQSLKVRMPIIQIIPFFYPPKQVCPSHCMVRV